MHLCAMAVVHVCSRGGVLGGGGEHDICKHVCGIKLDLSNVSIVKSLWVDLK